MSAIDSQEIPLNVPVEGKTYKTTRNKLVTTVYVFKIKHDTVVLKRDENCVDSFTVSRAKFEQRYKRIEPRIKAEVN